MTRAAINLRIPVCVHKLSGLPATSCQWCQLHMATTLISRHRKQKGGLHGAATQPGNPAITHDA